jgi:suppressor for copper-sensitivity B
MITKSTLRSVATGLLLLLAALIAANLPAHGASGPWQRTDIVEGRLVAAVDGAGSLDRVPLGLHLKMKPGWKTYWRSPGDAGLPPQLVWDGSLNLAGTEMRWPAPHRFTLFGIETFGYDGEVVLPITARPVTPGQALDLEASADLLVCSDICVPQRLELTLALPEGPATSSGADANLLARFTSQVPGDGAASGLSIESARLVDGALRVMASAREPFVDPDLFVEAGDGAAFGAPKIEFDAGDRRITVTLPVTGESVALEGSPVTLTLVDGLRSMERPVTVAGAGTGPGSGFGSGGAGLAAMLGFALIGGLLLNLMPCVLPVLSLKLLSVVGHGGGAPREIRAGFLMSAAGILSSFLVLAAAAVALKLTGSAVGWGIQFQQPLFLIFMVVLVTVFAANLWGLFEIPLPRAIADVAVGGALSGHHSSLKGHFATGALATLLATPCSAPFLGTAVGFALARGPLEIVAVFVTLGLGLALPYLAVAAFPSLAARLPRPGRWMVVLRRVLGVALALTGVWLLSVLAIQLSPAAALVIGALMAAVVATLAVRRRLPGRARLAGGAVAALLAVASFALPLVPDRTVSGAAAATDAKWMPFDKAAITGQVAAGRTVFVDVTASWCITCQANKRLVLSRDPVSGRLFNGGVVPMQADWTRPDDTIAAFLAEHGRYGIPFNIVYGPKAPRGIPLPELLTVSAVLEALDKAGG